MLRTYAIFALVFLCVSFNENSVESRLNEINNYELLDDEQDFNDDSDISENIVAILIENKPRNFEKALSFVQTVFSDDRFKNSDFWLITFNSSGVSSVWEKSYNNIEQFYRTLESLALQSTESPENKSLPFFALLNTVQTLPDDTAVIVFTESLNGVDTHLEKVTLKSILSKNITVYTVNENDLTENKILKNVFDYSGEETIGTTNEQEYEKYMEDLYLPEQNVSVILSRKKLTNISNLSFPVDHDVMGLHIVISPSKTTGGMLISPSGYKFTFLKNVNSSTIKYAPGSLFENQNGFFELHLNFTNSGRRNVGIWQLKIENSNDVYNVSVFAFTSISAQATIDFAKKGHKDYEIPKDVMKLGVTGKISHITDISVLDSNGEPVLSNISNNFNNRLKYVTENIDNMVDNENKEVNIEIDRQTTQPVYALVTGKDVKGNTFQRLGYIFGSPGSDIYPQQFLTVEVGLGSELIAASGRKAEIYFEVTNHANTAQLVTFSCSDHRYILQSLSLYKRYLEPHESSTAILYLNTRYGTYQDEITFTAKSGSLVVQKKVYVDVGSQIVDQNPPELYYEYTSDCTGVILSSCSKGTWTIEITAKDTESGLLQLNTVPKGLYFPLGYTSGTKDSVTGHFSESCCNPKLQISAVDRMNNVKSYYVNAYYSKWSPAAIAALVLGILLFIILVAVIIFFSVRTYRRRKKSYELPTYRGGGI